MLPPAPVDAVVTIDADGTEPGGAVVRWTRRSRAWGWTGCADTPIGEEREAYRVTISSGGATRDVETGQPVVAITAADRALGDVSVAIRQRGTFGESAALRTTVAGAIDAE